MERSELVQVLKKLSQLSKERDAYDNQIWQLEQQREDVSENKNNIQVDLYPAEKASAIVKTAENRAHKTITATKAWVWVVAILAMILTGTNTVMYILKNAPDQAVFLLLVPITACISVFCFHKIKEGFLGCLGLCLCWLFGIGCALECFAFFAMMIIAGKFSAIIFAACLVVGILGIILITKLEGWQERIISKYTEKAKKTKAYWDAESTDQATRYQNEQRRRSAVASKNQAVQRELDSIDSRIRELRQLRNNVDNQLKENTIYPYRDLNIINKVINKLEGMRANTLQEALLQCDRDSKENLRVLQEQWRREDEARDRRMQQQRDQENYWAQQRHNYAVEKEQKRQADELETIRRKLEEN